MAGVNFDPGVLESLTPEQKKAIVEALMAASQQQKPGFGDIAQGVIKEKGKDLATDYVKGQLGLDSLGSLGSSGSISTSAIPSAPGLSSGMMESLAQSMGPFQPGQAPLMPTTELSAMPMAVPAAVAIATALGARSGFRMLTGKQKNWKDASLADNAGRVALAMGTFGGSELANAIFGGHKSTRDIQRGNTKQLQKMSDDPSWQNYVSAMRAQHNEGPPDPSKPFAGKYATWEDYVKGGLEAGDLTGVRGNMKTFGPGYEKYSLDQQKAITQALINAGQYESKKGEVNVRDEDAAREIGLKALADFDAGGRQAAPNSVIPMPRGGMTITNGLGRESPVSPEVAALLERMGKVIPY